MQKIDWNMYAATQNSPGGPVIMFEPEFEPIVDDGHYDDAEPSLRVKIGRLLSAMIILGLVAYIFYAL